MLERLTSLVTRNIGLKVLSLLIAIAMWWGVAFDPVIDVPINAPIEFHNVPENLEISSESVPQAQIRVSGPARIVRELAQTEIHPIIDLHGAVPGERTYELTPARIDLPHNVNVVQIVPAQLRVSFDRRARRDIDVHPRVIGTFASGIRISRVDADPIRVTIVGPEKRVKAIENAITDPVDASGVIGSATFTTHAYLNDPLVRVVDPVIHVTVVTEKSNSRAAAP